MVGENKTCGEKIHSDAGAVWSFEASEPKDSRGAKTERARLKNNVQDFAHDSSFDEYVT